jgi:hypothetical protein
LKLNSKNWRAKLKTNKQKFKNDLTKKLEDTFGKDFVNEKIIIDINEDEENES